MRKNVVDHLGRTVNYEFPPKKIISLCPGITETLYSLQLENEIVGRTRYCVYPTEKVGGATIVGGTKEINMDIIKELIPDLIIVEKEENTQEIVQSLEENYPVFVAEVQSIQGAYRMIHDLANLTDRILYGVKLIEEIRKGFEDLPKIKGRRAAYVIWRKPYMVVGKNTYINSILEGLGFINPFTAMKGRYPTLTKDDLKNTQLHYLLLVTEPFPFQEKHKKEFIEINPKAKPIIVDGEMFWYGPKMKEAASYFKNLLSHIE